MTTAPAAAMEPPAIEAPRSALGPPLRKIGRWLAILLLAGTFGFPLYWTVTMSFKPQDEWNPPGKVFWFPDKPTVSNYTDILGIAQESSVFFSGTSRSAITPIEHSLIAAGFGTLLALFIGVFAAYGIARFRAGGRLLPFQILQLRMFPPIAIIIPLLFMWVYLGLWDTLQGMIILYAAVTFPFVVWLMRSFFQ